MAWRVRAATPADAERLGEIRVLSWRHAYRGILPDAGLAGMQPNAPHWAELAAAPPPTGLFVAVGDDDVPMAYCLVGAAREEVDVHPELATGELWAIYSDPAVLGTGAGRAVHDAGVAYMAAQGFAHAVLWVIENNDIGLRFYRATGWQADGGQDTFEWNGTTVVELRYAKTLAQPSSV
ncbi:MAG TPA: GNAT family N-acetyltransferase [Pseudonocardiaceae bacterium]|nr:GNAT family N-acetyltransferase [Pseudonocardiaceae bacterium]